ncbi:transcriptional regulator [Sphaerisporangium rufum]|uniref:Transcriptional regulator n=1 Tax=Sphaerisporangium rufum TaxID=1381558 RepID=A0A919R2D9_9ACTN|nr:ArsR family transcriptional regulator [Sphaerisporangium rufum]GII77146.1 transcriptional regulator [Sphaerisporangium rufum]
MLTFRLDITDLAATSFACSALHEAALSLRMWTHPGYYAEQADWFRRMRADFATLDTELLCALVGVRRWIPDFLTPRPSTPWPDFHQELGVLRRTPPEAVVPDLERTFEPEGAVPEPLRRHLGDPAELLERIADALEAYWARCLAPAWWPRARSVLEADIVYRARVLARSGAQGLFADLDPRLSWSDGTLTVRYSYGFGGERRADVAGRGLVLAPTMFARGAVTSIDPAGPPMIIYPARGRATMSETGPPRPPGTLERLLGTPRARLLVLLEHPASTTELAYRLGVTPGAVSQHLAVLRDARLVTRARHGRSVLYGRSALGDELCR